MLGVKTYSQLTISFAAVYKTVHPGCWLAFFEFAEVMILLNSMLFNSRCTSSRRLRGMRCSGWTNKGTDGFTVIWYWPWNAPILSELSGYCVTHSSLSSIGCVSRWHGQCFEINSVVKSTSM